MDKFLIPIEGLAVSSTWDVGATRIHSRSSAENLIASEARHLRDHDVLGSDVRDMVDGLSAGSIAEVRAESADTALDQVSSAVDFLRVFQHAHSQVKATMTMFGLPGDVYRSDVRYLRLGETSGPGFQRRGGALGWTFQDENRGTWQQSPGFTFAAQAVGKRDQTESERKAILGIQLASQAILEHRPAMKVLSLIMSLESMLLEYLNERQGFRLARRCAFFTCGAPDDLCGRARDTCPLLAITPKRGNNIRKLDSLRRRASEDVYWLCSDWLQVLDCYDLRSAIVHGDDIEVSSSDAGKIEFWLLQSVMEPALEWLASHPTEPLVRLDEAIDALPSSPDWEAIIIATKKAQTLSDREARYPSGWQVT
jgi:hypothetical protein